MTQNHAAIILASGLSQRLGEAKQLLRKDGEPLICYMTKIALATQPQAIIIVIPEDNSLIAEAVAKLAAQHAVIHTVVNPAPKIGMAHSLYLGIDALKELESRESLAVDRVLIIGVDQVLLNKEHLQVLLAGSQRVVASRYSSSNNWSDEQNLVESIANSPSNKNIIGLPLVIDYKLLTQWQVSLTGDKGLRHLIRGLAPHQMSTVKNHRLSYDIDTPSQLAHARAQRWLDS